MHKNNANIHYKSFDMLTKHTIYNLVCSKQAKFQKNDCF